MTVNDINSFILIKTDTVINAIQVFVVFFFCKTFYDADYEYLPT